MTDFVKAGYDEGNFISFSSTAKNAQEGETIHISYKGNNYFGDITKTEKINNKYDYHFSDNNKKYIATVILDGNGCYGFVHLTKVNSNDSNEVIVTFALLRIFISSSENTGPIGFIGYRPGYGPTGYTGPGYGPTGGSTNIYQFFIQ